MGVLLILAVMMLAWRTVGWALTILSAIFIAYAIAGPYMPEIIAHRGYDIPYITIMLPGPANLSSAPA